MKLCGKSRTKWREYLRLVLFANWILMKRTTGLSPFEVVLGQRAVLPVDIKWETFLGIDWDEVTTTKGLLEARFQQLACQDEMREVVFDKMMSAWAESVRYWDESNTH